MQLRNAVRAAAVSEQACAAGDRCLSQLQPLRAATAHNQLDYASARAQAAAAAWLALPRRAPAAGAAKPTPACMIRVCVPLRHKDASRAGLRGPAGACGSFTRCGAVPPKRDCWPLGPCHRGKHALSLCFTCATSEVNTNVANNHCSRIRRQQGARKGAMPTWPGEQAKTASDPARPYGSRSSSQAEIICRAWRGLKYDTWCPAPCTLTSVRPLYGVT